MRKCFVPFSMLEYTPVVYFIKKKSTQVQLSCYWNQMVVSLESKPFCQYNFWYAAIACQYQSLWYINSGSMLPNHQKSSVLQSFTWKVMFGCKDGGQAQQRMSVHICSLSHKLCSVLLRLCFFVFFYIISSCGFGVMHLSRFQHRYTLLLLWSKHY